MAVMLTRSKLLDAGTKLTQLLSKNWPVLLLLLGYLVAANLVTLHRFWQYEVFYYNHGIFDRALWLVAHGQQPLIDHTSQTPLHQLGDHFNPTLYLLIPLYWITSAYEPLIVIQNISVVAAGAVLYILSKKLLSDIAGAELLRLGLLLSFLLFLGVQNVLISGFHPESLAMLLLALLFFTIEHKKWWWYTSVLVLFIGTKELFVGFGIGVGTLLWLRKHRWQGISTIVFCVLYTVITLRYIVPWFSGTTYLYQPTQLSLMSSVTQLVTPSIKIKTVFLTLASFEFLPLLYPPSWPILIQDFFIRFVLDDRQIWDLGAHYSAVISVALYYSSIKAVAWLQRFSWYQRLAWLHVGFIFTTALMMHWRLRGPLGLAYNRAFYQNTVTMKFLDTLIDQIPNGKTVMTHNNLIPHLTHTNQVLLLRDDYFTLMPEVIALDIRADQNPNNYWMASPEAIYTQLLRDPNYTKHGMSDQQVMFLREEEPDLRWYQQKHNEY